MKSALLLLIAFTSIALALVDHNAPAINHDLIAAVNSNPSSTWVAGENDRLKGVTVKQFARLLGAKRSAHKITPKIAPVAGNIPATFDARTQWPGCVGPILDQGHCGSCWAFGATESLQDRFCIQSNGKVNVSLSQQMLVSCDDTNDGCDGGEPELAWLYLKRHGTVTESCYPYDMGTCHHPGCSGWNTPSCNKTCQNGDAFKKYFYYASSAYGITSNVANIQTEILTHGPVEVTFAVYEDFANYQSGVYIHTNGSLLGYHAVKNIGWGTSNGVDYWLIQNSWNTNWGMNGYFMIRRGTDECGIEDDVVAGLAKV